MRNVDRCEWRRGALWLASLLLLVPKAGLAVVQTTSVQGIVYRADGTVAQGTMLVSWPAFTAADGSTIAAGTTTATIAPDGSVNLALTPNAGANPAGTYYTVVYHLNDGTVEKEYWVVPQAATATIAEMRARVVPAAVARQTVSQQYVDASISALQGTLTGSYLQLKGGSMSGALNLASDPTSSIQAATKEYVDAHAGAQLPQAQNVIAGRGDGGAVSLAEKGVTVTGSNGTVAWDEDLNAGIYDPRDPRWAGGIYGPNPAAAAQAMSNQMACDLAMGKVTQAVAKWPQGTFYLDQLQIAPGSSWEGASGATGGTTWHSLYNNHQLAVAPAGMTLTCSDGNSHTDGAGGTRVSHFTLQGCAQGGCTNAPGDSSPINSANVGLEMTSTGGAVEYINANAFQGYGIRVDGQDSKAFRLYGGASGGNLEWFYYGGYKGVTESPLSTEVNTVTTGSTGSVALSWPAVTGATGYVVYRGTTSGNECTFYLTSTNSFADTGAAGAGVCATAPNISNSLSAPTGVTATPSTSGGTLAADTYYYVVTATQADGWHGSMEIVGVDAMADWVESYGMFDAPTIYSNHHLADILFQGGNNLLNHAWPQRGQVGISIPYGGGGGEVVENARVDFANQEGILASDTNVAVYNSLIGSSCFSANSATFNNGICDQLLIANGGAHVDGVQFYIYSGFGQTFETADIQVVNNGAPSFVTNTNGVSQLVSPNGLALRGGVFSPSSTLITSVTGPIPNVDGLTNIVPSDSSPITYTGFGHLNTGQTLYVLGGDANVTLGNSVFLETCTGQNLNLGNYANQYLEFVATASYGLFGFPLQAIQVCNTPATVASSETVTYSATPTFSAATRASIITLAGNVTTFTLAAGSDGQEKTLTFCQDATGGFTVAAPANVRGFFTVGTTASRCSSQHFTYSAAQSAWLADSPGVTSE